MANVLVVNAGMAFFHSGGKLNKLLTQVAVDELSAMGHGVKVTHLDAGYEPKEEIEKYAWADAIIYQQPGWWMGPPWTLKKYMDDVFTGGYMVLYESDGRSRHDASKKYGSGGLAHNKKFMISATWNAPIEAFTEEDQFFEGKGVDGVYFWFSKANQFLGMKPIPTFICNDVMKNPNIEKNVADYQAHLQQYFKAL